ncbi:Pyruvate decarboxylase 1 [Sporothrix stenoceras]|uniref:Pyruvate decarboxylase n=1 Tax=Sporothrix stenoceras TaxID=5173 RepID=A0ABR3Z5N2_9PEZI
MSILVGEYLFRRLKQLGVGTVFGVPGDYELALLDLPSKEGLEWIGTPNELVGAYAADGYARYKGFGALVTTFGPGELSALCGIGGAFCEFVPVVHIVGYPTTASQKSGHILHHTLGDGSYDHYIKMSSELSCATAVLKNAATATAEIDRVLTAMLTYSQPGYIGISEDIAYSSVPAAGLDVPLHRALQAPNDADAETAVVTEIVAKVEAAKRPVIIFDGGAGRRDWAGFADPLVEAAGLPFFVTTLGKGVVTETSPLFGGAYCGIGSPASVIEAVEAADCILWLGNLPSDFNTGMFSENVKTPNIVDFQRFTVTVGQAQYATKMVQVLPKLIEAIKGSTILIGRRASAAAPARTPHPVPETDILTQDYLWPRLSGFLQPGDLVVTETGTSQVGFLSTDLPAQSTVWTQAVYGSIGYAAGAAVGASVAAKATGEYKRMVLVTGEGSLQLTVQAFSILARHGLPCVVFVLNNKGYTVERYFHGFDSLYNDVPLWDYGALFKAFAPNVTGVQTYKVGTTAELNKLLDDETLSNEAVPKLFDIELAYGDAPYLLRGLFEPKAKAIEK